MLLDAFDDAYDLLALGLCQILEGEDSDFPFPGFVYDAFFSEFKKPVPVFSVSDRIEAHQSFTHEFFVSDVVLAALNHLVSPAEDGCVVSLPPFVDFVEFILYFLYLFLNLGNLLPVR